MAARGPSRSVDRAGPPRAAGHLPPALAAGAGGPGAARRTRGAAQLTRASRSAFTSRTAVKKLGAATVLLLAFALLRAQAPPPNVLLVTIDTVRADRIGAYGSTKGATPAIDRLAREGVRFADATTQAPLTGPAHAAILTRQHPAR